MVDPVSGLSIAAAVFQFVELGSKLVSGATKIYRSCSGSLETNDRLERTVNDFQEVSTRLRFPGDGTELSPDEKAITELAKQSHKVSTELLVLLTDLKCKGKPKVWSSVSRSIQGMLKKSALDQYRKEISNIREQLILRLLICMETSRSSSMLAVKDLCRKLDAIGVSSPFSPLNTQSEITEELKQLKLHHEQDTSQLAAKIDTMISYYHNYSRAQDIISSLAFPTMQMRRSVIRDAHSSTFQWVYDDNVFKGFTEWLETGSGIYWIRGKPGCGKSTFMKFVANHELTQKHLKKWSGEKNRVLQASYYFWSTGAATMEKSQQGLFQALLHDIICSEPNLAKAVLPHRRYIGHLTVPADFVWSIKDLKEAFSNLSHKVTTQQKVCFFIDGLDEYEGHPLDIIQVMKDLASIPSFKICLSSREWNHFVEAFGSDETKFLQLHKFTNRDIQQYIKENLGENAKFNTLLTHDEQKQLTDDITANSNGVFLWVFLVVRSLLTGLIHSDTLCDLQKRLHEIPADLEGYFERILNSVDKVYQREAAKILKLCLASGGSFSLRTLSFFDEKDPYFAISGLRNSLKSVKTIENRISARCTDLLNFVDLFPDKCAPEQHLTFGFEEAQQVVVSFIHKTVEDFLRTRDIQSMLQSRLGEAFDEDLYFCNAYICQLEETRLSYGISHAFLVSHFISHLYNIEKKFGRTEMGLIRKLTRLVKYDDVKILFPVILVNAMQSWFTCLAVRHGLYGYLQELYTTERCFFEEHLDILLFSVVEARLTIKPRYGDTLNMIRFLCDKGANPNRRFGELITWKWFITHVIPFKFDSPQQEKQHLEIVKTLIDHGASPYTYGDEEDESSKHLRYSSISQSLHDAPLDPPDVILRSTFNEENYRSILEHKREIDTRRKMIRSESA